MIDFRVTWVYVLNSESKTPSIVVWREREMGLNHHLGWDDKEEEEENWAKLGMNWLHNV